MAVDDIIQEALLATSEWKHCDEDDDSTTPSARVWGEVHAVLTTI